MVRHRAYRVASSPWFDYCMSIIIIVNCVTIGIEIQENIDRGTVISSPAFQAIENFFLVAYIFELTTRLLGDWETCFQSAWFQVDLALVVLGVIAKWVLEPLLLIQGAVGVLDKVLVVRILRLVRLVRALRFLRFMHPLWKLVKGLLGANGQASNVNNLGRLPGHSRVSCSRKVTRKRNLFPRAVPRWLPA